MTTTRYKGFTIEARPSQIQVSRQWTVELEIHRNGPKEPFSLQQHYPTQRDAELQCKLLGREIIDGVITGWSVDHLRSPGLRGYQDGRRHRLARAGILVRNVAILLVVALGAVALLTGALR